MAVDTPRSKYLADTVVKFAQSTQSRPLAAREIGRNSPTYLEKGLLAAMSLLALWLSHLAANTSYFNQQRSTHSTRQPKNRQLLSWGKLIQ